MAVTLTYNWQEITATTLYQGIDIVIDGRLTSQSVTDNKSTIELRWRNGGTYWRTSNGTAAFTGDFTDSQSCATYPSYINNGDVFFSVTKSVDHDNTGNATISIGGTINAIINGATRYGTLAAESVKLPQIYRYSIWNSALISIPNIDNAFTLPITKYVSSFYDVVEVRNSNNTTLVKTINNAANGQSVSFTSSEKNTILTMDDNATTPVPIRFYLDLKTYTNSSKTTQVGSTQRTKCEAYLVNGEPTFTFTRTETDTAVKAALGNNPSKQIRYASDLLYTITATPKYSATISSVKVNGVNATLSNGTYKVTISPTTSSVSIVVTDSRSKSTTQTQTLNLVNYVEPKIHADWSVNRASPTSSNLVLNAKIDAFNANLDTGVTNAVVVQYSINNTNWITIPSSSYTYSNNLITISNLTLSNIISYQSSCTFYLKAYDLLETKKENKAIPVGEYTFAYGKNKMKINGTLDVNGNTSVTGTLKVNNTSVLTSIPTASTSTKGGIKVGNNLTISNEVLSMSPTNLYNNTTGSNTSVTLSQSAANFTYLDIFYRGVGYYNCTRVYAPNGKDISLMSNTSGDYANLVVQMSFATATISGTTITLKNQAMINFSNTNGNYNWQASNTYIVRVDGYK